MRAMMIEEPGGPEVLEIQEVETPEPIDLAPRPVQSESPELDESGATDIRIRKLDAA